MSMVHHWVSTSASLKTRWQWDLTGEFHKNPNYVGSTRSGGPGARPLFPQIQADIFLSHFHGDKDMPSGWQDSIADLA